MAEVIDTLLVKLGLESDQQQFQQAEAQFAAMRSGLMGIAAAGAVAGTTLAGVGAVAGRVDKLGRSANQLDSTAQALDALGFALDRVGGDAGNAIGTLSTAQDLLDKLRIGETGAFEAASMWGLDAGSLMQATDGMEMLLELADQLEDKTTQNQRNILESLGLGSVGQFGMLTQGRDEFQSMLDRAQELGPLADSLVENSREFNQATADFTQAMQGVANVVADDLLPPLTRFANLASEWMPENREVVSDLIQGGPLKVIEDFGDKWLRENGLGFLARDVGEFIPGMSGDDERPRVSPEAIKSAIAISAGLNVDDVDPALLDAVMWQESRGRHRNASGGLTTNPESGARGAYQIMPATGRDPGYGVDPLSSNSLAEHRRFADDYLGALMDEFGGDTRATLAAYNWGPGNVKKARQQYGADWLEYAPLETQQYVPQVMKRMQGSVVNNNTIHIHGVHDPAQAVEEFDRRLSQVTQHSIQDMNNEVY